MVSNPDFVYLLPLWTLLFVGIWAIWNVVRDSRDEKLVERSLAWPEAQGKVMSSRVVWAHVEVKYDYSIASGRYEGKYKMNLPPGPPDRFGRTGTRMKAEAQQDIGDFPPGTNVVIRYNPQQPQQSVFYRKGEISGDGTGRSPGIPPEFITLS